uniref:Odorant receptor n=1 Tax=Adelphocoris lineolatus TaxID=236346 RepID=A0A2I4PH75_ADELI|nr:olfactory receptor 45 [Adelphocoris lineolatus]
MICSVYLFLFGVTAIKQIDDFVTATQTVHFALIISGSILAMVTVAIKRKHFIIIVRTMSVKYFDYGDSFIIPEMEEEYKNTKKQRIIFLTVIPMYFAISTVVLGLGRTIDGYFGSPLNETYVNDVYMLTPEPVWYPMKVDSDILYWFLALSVVSMSYAACITVAGGDWILFVLYLSITQQFKILIYRMRRINAYAYRLHRKAGGVKLRKSMMFSNSSFLKYFNLCLSKHAEHHSIIIKQFEQLSIIMSWPAGFIFIFGSVIIAMSLLGVSVQGGGKPSILVLATFLTFSEIGEMALFCGLSESIQTLGLSLHEELYRLNWADADISAKRTIMIMIEQSKRPNVLKAAGLQSLDWMAFSSIINTAYSYVNILMAVDA